MQDQRFSTHVTRTIGGMHYVFELSLTLMNLQQIMNKVEVVLQSCMPKKNANNSWVSEIGKMMMNFVKWEGKVSYWSQTRIFLLS